jgi:hypothetical protein
MMTYANHLGLFSEEIGLTGEQIGNFPQAFSYLALINAAVNLDHQLDHGSGLIPCSRRGYAGRSRIGRDSVLVRWESARSSVAGSPTTPSRCWLFRKRLYPTRAVIALHPGP